MEPIRTLENLEDGILDNAFTVFEPEQKVIYAITNAEGHVTQLVSSVFITEEQLVVAKPIAYGDGDNYTHIGEFIRNVLSKELFDENSCANYYIETIASEDGEANKYELLERTELEKQEEIAKRPVPEVVPTVQEVAASVAEMLETVTMLSDAMVEVDNSSTETITTVEALSDALVEVDNRASTAEAIATERTTDIQIIMDAIVELSDAIAAIQAKLDIQ